MRADLVIVTPLLFGDVSGASIDYQLLERELAARGRRVSIVTDREPPARPISGRLYRLFPARAARAKVFGRDHLAYAIQNVAYAALPAIVARERPRAVLVHTGLHNQPGLFGAAMRAVIAAQRRAGTRFVADVRDRLLPADKIDALAPYDAVVACGDSVRLHLEAAGVDRGRLHRIPVIQEPIAVDPRRTETLARELGLAGRPYVVYAGLIKEAKDVDVILRAYDAHARPRRPELQLAVIGPIKTHQAEIRRLLSAPGVVFAGPRPRADVLALVAGAAAAINVSRCEGLPRTSLEAIALGRPALLPPGIPEFARHCPGFVVRSHDPAALADQLLEIIDAGEAPDYPIGDHAPATQVPRYEEILFGN